MKKIKFFLFSIFLFFSNTVSSQNQTKLSQYLSTQIETNSQDETYIIWVFFKDKGGNSEQKLISAKETISKRSLERRKKLLKENPLVDFYDIPVETDYINALMPHIKILRHKSKWLNAVSVEADVNQINKLASYNFVELIDVVRLGKYTEESRQNKEPVLNKSLYNLNYGNSLTQLEQINVPFVHDLGFSADGIMICVMDAGFNNLGHQAFSSMNIIDTYDFVNDDNNVDDEWDMGTGNHGTNTLSTIGGFYEGQLIGPAYGALYLLAKTENTDSETPVEEDNWVAAIEWAELLGVEVTSTSLGYIDFDDGSGYDASELDGNTAIITIAGDIAAGKGILVVNSAGNEGSGITTIGAPADGDSILAVGAVYSDGTRTSFSSVGPTGDGRIKPDVMAMGSEVYVASTIGDEYNTASGTSFSCPLTAGAAALLWGMVPTASNMDIFEALKMSADNSDNPNNEYGWGIIDIYDAYEYLQLPRISHIPIINSEDFIGPYTVTAQIKSIFEIIYESSKVFFRRDNGIWNELLMTFKKDSQTYSADIPGNNSPAVYDYYISTENINGIDILPENAPSGYFSFTIATIDVTNLKHEQILLFPNPTNKFISLIIAQSFGNEINIDVYDYTGKTVLKQNNYQNEKLIDVSNLTDGIYICKIETKTKTEFLKFVITK